MSVSAYCSLAGDQIMHITFLYLPLLKHKAETQ